MGCAEFLVFFHLLRTVPSFAWGWRVGRMFSPHFLKVKRKVKACLLCSLLLSIYYSPCYVCVHSMPLLLEPQLKEEKVCVGLWKTVSLYIIKR